MKKLIGLSLLILSLLVCFVSCDFLNKKQPSEDDEQEITDWNVEAVYAKAQSMGYTGSLEEFIALVSGKDGQNGAPGKSAYEIAVEQGFEGTEEEWINSIGGNKDIGVFNVTFKFLDEHYIELTDLTFTLKSNNFRIDPPNDQITLAGYEINDSWYFLDEHRHSYEYWYFDAYAVTKDITLYAYVRPTPYTITIRDVSGNTIDTFYYYTNNNFDVPNLLEYYRLGYKYTFLGYTWDGQTTPTKDVTIKKGNTGNKEFTAHFEKSEYNDPNGITYNYDWQETDIIVKLTNSSNSNELSSGCKRYYAGQDSSAFQDVDIDVRTRNQLAQKAANVKVKYRYIEESDGKGWGGSIKDMQIEVGGDAQNIPDIYCNFAYDMTCASLRGCFANLLQDENNYFRFKESGYTYTSENYFDSTVGEGYFYQYMRSLSLTPDDKLYCLASDYTIDVMRAFLVMPVNVSLINSISLDKVTNNPVIKDYDGDSDHDIDDFYKLVWEGGWNYDALAAYSAAVFQGGSDTTKPQTDISDTVVGLALGQGSGLTASGLLYTTSVKIIEKKADGSYKYPETNDGLTEFAQKLLGLVEGGASTGICVVNKAEAMAVVPGVDTELKGIRARFASNNVLFGGIVCVGSLEDSVYQNMKANGGEGFGVVPVPLYKAGGEYKTLVHNLARIMAISKVSTKFGQCSAFLDYQSRCSHDILEGYYTNQLTAAVSGGTAAAENSKMLNYIRNHVNDCFDKTFEDAIANYAEETDPDATATRFHGYLGAQGYKVVSFSTVYETVLKQKQTHFDTLWTDWQNLK